MTVEKEQKINSVAEDILQELKEAELEAAFGYEKKEKCFTENFRI